MAINQPTLSPYLPLPILSTTIFYLLYIWKFVTLAVRGIALFSLVPWGVTGGVFVVERSNNIGKGR